MGDSTKFGLAVVTLVVLVLVYFMRKTSATTTTTQQPAAVPIAGQPAVVAASSGGGWNPSSLPPWAGWKAGNKAWQHVLQQQPGMFDYWMKEYLFGLQPDPQSVI
jgi:hypothetical protein